MTLFKHAYFYLQFVHPGHPPPKKNAYLHSVEISPIIKEITFYDEKKSLTF